jgi:glycerol-3-phosphate dehydrogenase
MALTTYRPMARRFSSLPTRNSELGPAPGPPERTATIPLSGAVVGPAGLEAYHAERSRNLIEAGVAPSVAERLCWLYGKQLDHLLELASADPS